MQDQDQIVNTVAPITNVRLLSELVERAKTAAPGLPRMAVFYGQSGWGKSVAAIFAANAHESYSVQMKSSYTGKHFLEMVAREIGLETRGTMAQLVDRIGAHLARPRGPQNSQPSLLIDEADILVKRKMIELVRDLYESSGAAIILIGEEAFPRKLEQWERVHGRMMDWVAAQPVSTPDAKHLAKIYCPNVEIEDSLFKLLLQQSSGSARRISVNLNTLREFCRLRKLDHVSLDDWKGKEFFTGQPPAARSGIYRGAA